MRTITVNCDDKTAKALVELLLDVGGVFSISSADSRPSSDAPPRKKKSAGRLYSNNGFKLVLSVGRAMEHFTVKDLEARASSFGLHANSVSPAVSRLVAQGLLLRDGKDLWLSTKGKAEAAKTAPQTDNDHDGALS